MKILDSRFVSIIYQYMYIYEFPNIVQEKINTVINFRQFIYNPLIKIASSY